MRKNGNEIATLYDQLWSHQLHLLSFLGVFRMAFSRHSFSSSHFSSSFLVTGILRAYRTRTFVKFYTLLLFRLKRVLEIYTKRLAVFL